jgi:serine/threonine-protein kinase
MKLGRYEIIGDLAVGGMAEIVLARLVGPSGFERLVVLKRIFPHLAKDPEFVTMFLDEARTVARINHPNVVQVHELAQHEAELFLAMEYLEGETVSGLLRRLWSADRRLEPALAAHVVAEACRGLQAAHDLTDDEGIPLGLVHRDVSPQNLFVTYAGAVKILDFGIAKLDSRSTKTEPGQIKGKFAYMSPEQCAGKNLDRRSDVFSLGIVLHEVLTGHRLFARDSEMATLRAVCEGPIVPPSALAPAVPPALDKVCLRALARRRDERFESCAEMRRELLAALREAGGADDCEAALAALMQSLYPDRIAEKREMVRRARLGHRIDETPRAETDQHVELPKLDEATVAEFTSSPAREPEPPKRRRRSVALAIGAVVLAAAVTVGGWAAMTGPSSAAATAATESAAPPVVEPAAKPPAIEPSAGVVPSATAPAEPSVQRPGAPVRGRPPAASPPRPTQAPAAPAPPTAAPATRPEML